MFIAIQDRRDAYKTMVNVHQILAIEPNRLGNGCRMMFVGRDTTVEFTETVDEVMELINNALAK